MDQLLHGKALLRYSDNSYQILDKDDIALIEIRSPNTQFSNVNWNKDIINLSIPFSSGKYFMKYLRGITLNFSWFTKQKQVDLFFMFISFGIELKEVLNYTMVSNDILKICVETDLTSLIEADRSKSCEEQLLQCISPENQSKISRHYFNETGFLSSLAEGSLTESALLRWKKSNNQPTHLGKQFVNRNQLQITYSIIRKGRSSLGDLMLRVYQEYTGISFESFLKNVEALKGKWETTGNLEMARCAESYCASPSFVQTPVTSVASLPKSVAQTTPTTTTTQVNNSTAEPELLKRWTGMRDFKVVYESDLSTLELANFNASICGKPNLMLIITTTDGYVFGSFSSITIPQPLHWVKKDAGHFVFTLVNPHGVPPTRFFPNKPGNSIYIFQNDYMISVIAVQGSFKINMRSESVYSSRFPAFYGDTTGKGASLFVSNPDKFEVKSIKALEFF
ncbi:TLDc domain-containing protein [Entamoeba marina]